MGGTMSGMQFWITVVAVLTATVPAYLIGYRTGFTDGTANGRKWAER